MHPFVREITKPVLTNAFYSQPGQPPCTQHILNMPAYPPPVPPPPTHPSITLSLLAQNLSLKQIAPTDNMQPKLHDEHTPHQVNRRANGPIKVFSKIQKGSGDNYSQTVSNTQLRWPCKTVNEIHHLQVNPN